MSFLRWIIGVLIIVWLLGFVLQIGGGLIHIIIVIAVILFVFDFIGVRKL
ncbi:lmo0937 family membrane protein [Clostridium estertheticum]|nr:lmo0937 family membrane protein [Clostridium estertheticum]MBZ9617333.1 lmo0937 family membrane protein [Clostridium estertheticum subsp. laramiense]WAG73019.1 lmo0937 family membrane protein [Clostridium estertheticum]